jgi:hypothetical protein
MVQQDFRRFISLKGRPSSPKKIVVPESGGRQTEAFPAFRPKTNLFDGDQLPCSITYFIP